MKTALSAFLFVVLCLLLSTTTFAQVTTNEGSGLAATYPSLSAAITALNGASITSPVVITLSGNETCPAGGYSITATGTASNTIIIEGSSSIITAPNPAGTAGALNDAIFKIIGGDFITIRNFTMQENSLNTTTAAASNNMVEWGVALLYASTTNGCQNITIDNNIITLNKVYQNSFGIYSNSTHSATSVTTSATATGAAGGNHNLVITRNTISNVNNGIVVVGPTAAADMNATCTIGGSVANANSVTDYGTTGTFSGYANVSGTVNGILVRNTINFTVSHNTVTSSNGSVTAGTINGIQIPAFSVTPTGTFTNSINNNNISVRSGVAAGAINGINHPSGSASTTSTLNINNNDFNNFGHTVASSGSITCIINASTHLNVNINNNTFTNLNVNTTGSFTFISNSYTAPATGTKNINNNSIVTAFNKTGAGGTVTLHTDNSSSPAGVLVSNSNNNFSNITLTGATTMAGWSNLDGGTPTKTIQNNTFNNWTGGTSAVTGLNVGYSAAGSIVTGNIITNITGQGAVTGLVVGTTSAFNVFSNTINTLSSTGTGGAVMGISITSGSNNVYSHSIYSLSSTSTAVTGISVSGATLHNIYKNKIYNLSSATTGTTSPAVAGLTISAGTAVNAYNNLIGGLSASTSASTDAVRGINITATTTSATYNIYYNTVSLAASSTGANFGTTGIFHTASATATTAALNLRNNIIVNNSTPNGTGLSVAYRRSGTALANYASTSNNNSLFAPTIMHDGTTAYTMATYKTLVAPRDAASFSENPTFISTDGSSADFLHLSLTQPTQCESGAQPIAGITDDFDGVTRNTTTPDVGADEGDFVLMDLVPPSISYTPLLNTGSTANRDLNATITDPSGVDGTTLTAPRIYFKKSTDANVFGGNTSTDDGWKWTEATGSSPFTLAINYSIINGGSVSEGTIVQYFVVAQDLATTPNVGANPSSGFVGTSVSAITSAPTTPNSYLITASPLSGDYTVGTALFNQVTGKNITFQQSVRKVMKEVWVEDPTIEKTSQKGSDIFDSEYETSFRANGHYEMMEVEEIVYTPMENGKVYTGDLYAKKADDPSLLLTEGTKGVYATITAAVNDLNLRGVSGATTFLLVDASYPSETYPITVNVNNDEMPSAVKTVTIKPNAGIVSAISGASASGPVFRIRNNYVTIDGSNSGGTDRSLTITNTSATSPQVVHFASSGTTPLLNGTLRNCIIVNGVATSSAVVINDLTGTAGYFNNITIQNNDIRKAFIGVFANATVATGNGSGMVMTGNTLNSTGADAIRLVGLYAQGVDGVSITNNTLGNFEAATAENDRGIWLATATKNATVANNTISALNYTGTAANNPVGIAVSIGILNGNISITNNTISGLVSTGASSLTALAGIWVFGATEGVMINRNRISNIKNNSTGGWSANGIVLASTLTAANITAQNNFIWDIAAYGWSSTTADNGYGINILSGGGYNLYHNSVHLATNQTLTTGVPACLIINSAITTANTLNIRNNIFSITATVGTNRYTVLSNAANTVFADINYNDYYFTSPNLGFIGATDRADLAAWRTGTGKDANSVQGNPGFVSATDLHINPLQISPVSNAGFYLSSVPTDIDDENRLDPPDIGADEYTGVMPAAFALLTPANGATGVVLNGSLTWESSTYADNYDVYLDKVDATTLVSSNQIAAIYDYVNLDASATYYWKVVAKNANGNTVATGAPWSFTTLALLPPNPPTDLVFSNITNDAMDLSWTQNSDDETGFYIYKSLNGTTFTQVDAVGADVTTYTGDASRTLGVNTRVWWRVTAYNANGESGFTGANAFTLANTPGQPTLSEVAISSMKVNLNTAGNPASSEFVVRAVYGATTKYMNTAGALVDAEVWGTYTAFGGAAGRTVTGLNPNTNYTFDVKAKNGNNIETIYGTSASALTLSHPSSMSENFATYTGFAPPPVGWNEGDQKDILGGGTFGTASNGGWTVDGFGNVGTTGAARFNYFGTTTADHDWIISPNVNLTNKKASQLAFDIALTIWNTTTPTVMDANDTMFVVISTDGGNTFPRANVVAAYHAGTPISATGQREVVNLTAFAGQPNVRIGFYVKDLAGGGDKDFFLDNVVLQEILQKDIEVLSVSMTPVPPYYVGSNVTVTAQIRNNGEEANPTSVPLTYKVGSAPTAYEDGNGEIFTPSWTGNTATVSFTAQINLPSPGNITTFVRSFYPDDQNGTNDINSTTIKVLPVGALFEDFTDVNALARWKVINGDAGPNTWVRSTAKFNSAPASAGSLYESATVRNNDWLITPKLTVTATDSFSFWHSIHSASYPESLYIRISTVGNNLTDPWTDLLAIRDATTTWKYRAISLAAYAGQNVWIAFVNRSLDMWTVYVDDISGPAVYVPAVDLAFTSFYQSSGLPTPKSGELFTDYNISMNEKSLEDGVKPLASLIDNMNGEKASNENYSIVIPSIENVSTNKSFAPVDIKAEVKNVGLNAASYTLNWNVSGVPQTAYPGPSVAPATTHLADLAFLPSARGTFLTTGALAVTGDENPDNNNSAFRMRVYPSEFTRIIYDRGDNVVDTWVGWGGAGTTAMKAGVRFTATSSRKLAGVDFICNTEAVSSGTIVVQVRAAGTTNSAPGAVLYSKLYSSLDYFPGGGGYITFPFDDDAPVIASGSDYWITIKFPVGILFPGGVHNTGFTPGRSFYEGSPDTTVWNALVITTERAWIMRSYSVSAPSSISGVKFNDLNGNGIKDAGEPGLQGWFISLNGPVNATTETDANGNYSFNNLPNGDYLITEDQQVGWLQTMPGAPGSYSVTITGGQTLVRNFGNYKYAKISGYKWLDANGNGIWDSGEVPLADWTINLAGPVNSSVVTNGDGYFEFLEVLAGNYSITETAQSGWLQIYPVSSHSISIISGDIIAGRSGFAEVPNFGNFLSGSISGYKFSDLNANGLWDSGEPPLAGWTINLTGAATRSTVTNENGWYLFSNLLAGSYSVGEVLQSGWIQSHPAAPGTHAVDIVSGVNIENMNFGNYRNATITGIKFWDRNANGIKDAGEVGLEGWDINLTGLVNPLRTTTTNASGTYIFTNVMPDVYTITEVVKSGWSLTTAPASFAVVSGDDVVGKNFGNFLSADSSRYRTFLHEAIVALDAKNKVPKSVKRKNIGGYFEFTLTNNGTSVVNEINIKFKNDVRIITAAGPFETITNVKKDFKFRGGTLEPGQSVVIKGHSSKGKPQSIAKYWLGIVTKTPTGSAINPTFAYLELPMPTYSNLIEETFRDAGFATTGLVIGTPHPAAPKDYGWVSIKKAADVQKSLRDKAVIHSGLPGFFEMFGTKFFRGEKKTVPPTKHNNLLFAELLALKLAIAASATEHAPVGLGELVYHKPGQNFHGLMLNEIADSVSKAMTSQLGDAGAYYLMLREINEAFAGTFDTLSFGIRTKLKGTKMLSEIPFLRAIPGMPITRIVASDNKYYEVPDIFELAQNYPNPFNPTTTIEFILPEDAMVTLKVYNILGQEVASLINNELYTEGRNDVEFDAGKLSSGVYFYRLTAEGFGEEAAKFNQIKKMVLMK